MLIHVWHLQSQQFILLIKLQSLHLFTSSKKENPPRRPDLHLPSHQTPFFQGGARRERAEEGESGRGTRDKCKNERKIEWGGCRGREWQSGDGKWQYNVIWFVVQNGFSVPIFWDRGDGGWGEGGCGRQRWVECEQQGRGVHLALEPWDGLTGAGGELGCSL